MWKVKKWNAVSEVRWGRFLQCDVPRQAAAGHSSYLDSTRWKLDDINASLEPKRTLIHFLKKNHLSWSSHHCHHYQYHNRHHYYLAWIVEQLSCNLCAGASIIIIIKSYKCKNRIVNGQTIFPKSGTPPPILGTPCLWKNIARGTTDPWVDTITGGTL